MSKLNHELYCDYDGVLVNFRKGILELKGQDVKKDYYTDTRKEITVDFWANLEPMSDWRVLWNFIEPYEPHILTAFPKWDDKAAEIADEGKRIWNRKYTKVPEERMHIVTRQSKKYFARNFIGPNVLIDDDQDNIYEWSRAGGIAIYHDSGTPLQSVVDNLKLLGYGT